MFKLVKRLVIGVVLTMGWVNGSVAASFDCNKATTKTEVAICNDPDLSKLDETLAVIWKREARSNDDNGKQRAWLTNRDVLFDDPTCKRLDNNGCLIEHYEYRIQELVTGCAIDIDIPKKWDEYYPLDELEMLLEASNKFEDCRLAKLNALDVDFEKVSASISLTPMGSCAITFDPFMYPISERSGHYAMSRCAGPEHEYYEKLLNALLNLIQKRHPELIENLKTDQHKWETFSTQACQFYEDSFNDAYNGNLGGIDKCRADAVKFRLLYLSPLVGIDEFFGYPASTINELLGEDYGEY